MEKDQRTCPSCGAEVFPDETRCPVCHHALRTGTLTRVLVGVTGTVVALLAGAGVWWVLSDVGSQKAAAPAAPSVVEQPAAEAAAPEASMPSAAVTAPPPAWPQDGEASATGQAESEAKPAAPQTQPQEPIVPATVEERQAFAKETEQSLSKNGLDLSVSTSGAEHKTLVMTFNYPAASTAELIVAGPFPRQCERRGFTRILFVDPGESTFVYDIATQTLSSR